VCCGDQRYALLADIGQVLSLLGGGLLRSTSSSSSGCFGRANSFLGWFSPHSLEATSVVDPVQNGPLARCFFSLAVVSLCCSRPEHAAMAFARLALLLALAATFAGTASGQVLGDLIPVATFMTANVRHC
jgi:hypothetical protein